jgi:hypothetical protein
VMADHFPPELVNEHWQRLKKTKRQGPGLPLGGHQRPEFGYQFGGDGWVEIVSASAKSNLRLMSFPLFSEPGHRQAFFKLFYTDSSNAFFKTLKNQFDFFNESL